MTDEKAIQEITCEENGTLKTLDGEVLTGQVRGNPIVTWSFGNQEYREGCLRRMIDDLDFCKMKDRGANAYTAVHDLLESRICRVREDMSIWAIQPYHINEFEGK